MSLTALVFTFSGATLSFTEPFTRDTFALSRNGTLWIFSAVRAVSLLGVLFGILADRIGRRRPFLVAFSLLPLGNIITAFSQSPITFTIGQSITRFALLGVATLTLVIMAEELTPELRGFGLGLYAMAASIGSGLGLILIPIAERTEESWRILFGLSGCGILLLPLLIHFVGESRAFVSYPTKVSFRRALKAGLGRHFRLLAGMSFFIALFTSPSLDLALERLIVTLEWEAAPARFLLVVFGGLGSLGFIVGGRLADRVGRRETTVLALMIGLIGGIAFYSLSSGWVLAPAVLLATFGASLLVPAFAAHRTELFPTRVRAMATGWLANIAIFGSIAGFLVGTLIVDRLGITITMSALGMGLIISMLLALRLPETRGLHLVRGVRPRTTMPTHSNVRA